jgi:hydroxypyruvate isomerase
MMFAEHPFLDRIAAAAQAGFRAVEWQFAYEFSAREIAARLAANGVVCNHVNTPRGEPGPAAMGFAALPGRQAEFRANLDRALEHAVAVGARTIHCMCGAPADNERHAARETFLENMALGGARAKSCGVTLVIEPLNAHDRPGYFVSRSDEIVELLRLVDHESVKLLFDFYHIQISEGDLVRRLEKHWPFIGHVQIAGAPERHEPDLGEFSHARVMDELVKREWRGFVGAEYYPRGETLAGLGWAKPWLAS